jgi:competence protein ComEC
MLLSPRIIAGYPAVRFFAALALGIVFIQQQPVPSVLLLPPAAGVLFAAVLLWAAALRYRSLAPLRDLALGMLLVVSGMCLASTRLESLPRGMLAAADKRPKVAVGGVVLSSPRSTPSGQSIRFRCDTLITDTGILYPGEEAMLYYTRSSFVAGDTLLPLRPGDRIRAEGKLRSPRPARNPWAFNARDMLLQEGMTTTFGVSKGSDLTLIAYEAPGFIQETLHSIRIWISDQLGLLFSPSHLGLMRGLLLGDRGDIERDVLDDFRASGIMHILAVSGLHAGIIVTMVLIPLERLRFGIRGVLAIAAVWTFAGMTGFAPPVQRAAMMSTLFIMGRIVQRGNTTVNALSVAGAVILLMDPLALFSLSFQLSFGAVFGILVFQERVKRTLLRLLPKRWRKGFLATVVSLFALTASAQLCTVPLTLPLFGEFSVAGFGVNLIAVPLVFVVVTCGMLSALLQPLWQWSASMLAHSATGALDLILFVSQWSASQPWAVWRPSAVPWWLLPIYALSIAWLAHREGRLRQKLALLTLALSSLMVLHAAMAPPEPERLRVSFLDVGQGDAALLQFPGNVSVLIDTGPSSPTSNAGATVIVPYLRRLGIDTLDYLLLTHPDNDHIGGAASVLDGVAVRHVLLTCSWPRRREAQQLLQRIRDEGSIVEDAREGEVIRLHHHAALYMLSPEDSIACDASNHRSLVTLLRYGRTRWLFTGDADIAAERRMLQRYDTLLRADVLKVGHHGSKTSTAAEFVHAVQPRHAVICAGRLNHFKHPKFEVLQRLWNAGSKVHRTDIEGAVLLESDGENIWKRRW